MASVLTARVKAASSEALTSLATWTLRRSSLMARSMAPSSRSRSFEALAAFKALAAASGSWLASSAARRAAAFLAWDCSTWAQQR